MYQPEVHLMVHVTKDSLVSLVVTDLNNKNNVYKQGCQAFYNMV